MLASLERFNFNRHQPIMHVVTLKISDDKFADIKAYLKRFSSDDLEILDEGNAFEQNQTYLNAEWEELKSGKSSLISLSEARADLENFVNSLADRI
jgi:hypothetical protein